MDPEQFSSQDSNIMLEQKAAVFPQQYASQAQMAQGSYPPMQDPNFHTMGQRPSYATLRMQPRPGLRPTGLVQNQPNQLRLQLQHRLQAQQVRSARCREVGGQGRAAANGVTFLCPWGGLTTPPVPSRMTLRLLLFSAFLSFLPSPPLTPLQQSSCPSVSRPCSLTV